MSITLEPMAMCSSWEDFVRQIKSPSGGVYTVTHGYTPEGRYQFGFHCNCKAFQFGRGKECKHIKAVKSEACLWHEQFDGGSPKNGMCPKCSGPVKGVMCAV